MERVRGAVGTGPLLRLDEIQVAVLVHDRSGRIRAANAPARELFGLTEDELLGQSPLPAGFALLGEDGRELPFGEQPVGRVLATGEPARDATVGIRRPRACDVAWAVAHAGPRLGPDGEIRDVVATYVDVTARKLAELKLKDSETRYRTLFDSMDSAVLLMRGPTCIACNPTSARIFGLARAEDLLGKTPLDFAPPLQPDGVPSAQRVQQYIELALKNGSHTFEWTTTRSDGTPIQLEVRFTPFALGDGGLFQCIARDVTEHKRAEQRLKQSEEQFRVMIERATEGILVAEADGGRVRYANPLICRMLGYQAEELLRLCVTDLHPPEERVTVAESFERGRRGGGAPEVRTRCRRKDGTVLDVAIQGFLTEVAGTPCLVGFFRDETTRRAQEEERLRTQKLEAVGLLAGGIAHDFNNLLQGVFGYLAVARHAAGDPEQVRDLLSEAEKAMQLAVGLTGQLLTFSGGGRPVKKTVALGPLLETTTRLAISGSPCAWTCELGEGLWPVQADAVQLSQAVHNVVLNAVEAMAGGGTVVVGARNVVAPGPGLPARLPAGRFVAVEVRDTGVGIPPANLPRIFDPYFSTKSRGSGLGLATAYAVLKSHDGLVDARSELGVGSAFTLYLPASAGAAEEGAAAPAHRASRRARVLVMDDEPVVRDTAARFLAVLGHEATVSAHGSEALDLFRQAHAAGRPFDVVVLDLTVRGGMGGLEAVRRLLAEFPSARAIVSSGYSGDAALADHRRHGFAANLRKPYTLEEMERAIADVVGP